MVCTNCRREIANESNFCYLCGARQMVNPVYSRGPRRLQRSVTDSKIAGVCGGLAEYWDVDPTVVRLVTVVLVLFPVPFVPVFFGYIVAWIVVPKAEYPVYMPAQQQVPSGAPQPQAR